MPLVPGPTVTTSRDAGDDLLRILDELDELIVNDDLLVLDIIFVFLI